jgi:hypothetical protein
MSLSYLAVKGINGQPLPVITARFTGWIGIIRNENVAKAAQPQSPCQYTHVNAPSIFTQTVPVIFGKDVPLSRRN